MGSSNFRFQILDKGRARKPIIWLAGHILEGIIYQGDRLELSLENGELLVATVVGMTVRRPPAPAPQNYESISFKENGDDLICIGIWRDSHECEDILCDIATNYGDE